MKKLFYFIVLAVTITGCSKSNNPKPANQLPNLNGSTWYTYSYTGPSTGTKYYDYMHFKSADSVDMYTSDINGQEIDFNQNGTAGITTNKYQVSGNTFTIFFKNGQNASGASTDNQAVIMFQGVQYVKK